MKEMRVSWREFESLTDKLCEKIKRKNENFDNIICIATGGLILGKLVSEKLTLPLGIISMKAYEDKKLKKLKFDKHISTTKKVDGSVLLIDDIADSGTSLRTAFNYLVSYKGIKKVKTATLFNKPSSSFIPHYFVKETSDWVVFPYEKS